MQRYTPLFAEVWPEVKAWFADKPEAFSMNRITDVEK